MGSCCSTSGGLDFTEGKLFEGDKDMPEVPPAVYIDLTIPSAPVVPPEMNTSGGDQAETSASWGNVNFDNIIVQFREHSGVWAQLIVRQQDSLYFKRLCDNEKEPKPVITATVTNPENSGWHCGLKSTLWNVINGEFGDGLYQISIVCPPPPKHK